MEQHLSPSKRFCLLTTCRCSKSSRKKGIGIADFVHAIISLQVLRVLQVLQVLQILCRQALQGIGIGARYWYCRFCFRQALRVLQALFREASRGTTRLWRLQRRGASCAPPLPPSSGQVLNCLICT